MERRRFFKALGSALIVLGLAGCAVDTTGPKIDSQLSTGLVGDVTGLLTTNVLERKTPLDRDISVSASISSAGGTLTIPKAGLTLVVPKGAVSTKTKFTVTALAGKGVAYEMGPHGLNFPQPLVFTQDLSVTKYSGGPLNPLKGAYFSDRSLIDTLGLTGRVSELFNGNTSQVAKTFTFKINHFSGYIVAW